MLTHEADFYKYGQLWPYKAVLEIPAVWLRVGGKYSEVSASRTPYSDVRLFIVLLKLNLCETRFPFECSNIL